MPSRDEQPSPRPRRGGQTEEAGATQKTATPAPVKTPQTGEDVWDTINDMKGGSGEGEFNKMNTSFFLRDEEEAEVVFLDENPTIFFGHNIKCESDAGKTFYRTEQCQKSEQDYCTMCDSTNTAIGKANRVIGFRLVDSRGSWDGKKKELNGVPTPKIFLVPLYFAKQIKLLKDEQGTITDKVIKITKNGNYQANFKMNKIKSGGYDFEYIEEDEFDEMDIPEILDVYAPMEDEELIDFLDKFSAKAVKKTADRPQDSGRKVGGFGKR